MSAAGARKIVVLLTQELYFQRKMGKDMGKVSPPRSVGIFKSVDKNSNNVHNGTYLIKVIYLHFRLFLEVQTRFCYNPR